MLINTTQARLPLTPGRLTHIDLPAHTRVRGLAGQSWITLDHDQRDIVLGPGEEFVTEAAAHVIACALRSEGSAELLVLA